MATLSAEGQPRTAAWECGSSLQSQQTREISALGAEFDQTEVFRFGRGAIRADAGGRALGGRRRDLRLITKPCAVGCWPKDCGAGNGSGRNTANEGSAKLT